MRGFRTITAVLLFLASGVPELVLYAESHLVVRPKRGFSKALSAESQIPVQKLVFETEQEKQEYLLHLDQKYEAEENVMYTGEAVSLNDGVQSPVTGDPLFANQWPLSTVSTDVDHYKGIDIDAVRAWTITRGSSDVVIYVMDSGINKNDPDLKDRVTSGYNAFSPGTAPDDQNGHGTHVASIAAANGENGIGISGVVPGAIQVGDAKFLNESNSGDSVTALNAIHWIESDFSARLQANPKMKCVVNNSYGGDVKSDLLESDMKRVAALGCLFVTSAGNHGSNNDTKPYYPCNFALTGNTCVAASDRYDAVTSYSGFGPQSVHILAPGQDILGVVVGTFNGNSYVSQYDVKRGTSQAVPHVSGVAALIWAANPALAATDVRQIIINSADKLPNGEQYVLAAGRLNAYRALLIATGQDPALADRGFTSTKAATKASSGGCSLEMNEAAQSPSLAFISLALLFCWSLFAYRRRFVADK